MKVFFLFSQIHLIPLFSPDAPITERLEKLQPYFDPPIGSIVTADRVEMREKTQKPMSIRGFIKVRPPANHCFILRRSYDQADETICKPTDVAFSMHEIKDNGRIEWHIIQGPNDQGTPVSWQTPYRVAKMIDLGQFDSGIQTKIPIATCQAEKNEYQRKITLHLMNGQRWVILFPKKDILLEPNKKTPNLFVRTMTTSSDGKSFAIEASSGGEIDGTEEKISPVDSEDYDRHAILALKLSGRYKEVEEIPYFFNIDAKNSFEMNSARLLEKSAPIGMNGNCRYRFTGAPSDPESGVIECYNSESYDAIYFHMNCSRTIGPQLD
ncbi:MAG: hypothetical protein ACOH5I_08540 [Oligoflexus sp.]